MTGKRKTIFDMIHQNAVDYSIGDFEKDALKAADAGATHVMVSALEKSRWIWERDRTDPYPNWGMLLPSLFKIIVPRELEGRLPGDYAGRNLETLRRRMDVLGRLGLKGAMTLCEPFYLPEEVYADHPDWRGPRCDHPRRARNAYYSPCADHPEILAMYRTAMAELLGCADIDYFHILTNDSGAGLCWSTGLYPGANGPSRCRGIPQAQRILGFLESLDQGAREAGRDVEIEINANIGFKESERSMDSMWPSLPDNFSVNYRTNRGTPMTSVVDVGYEYTLNPVRCIPLVSAFTQRLEAALKEDTRNVRCVLPSSDHDEYFRIAKEFSMRPVRGPAERAELLRKVAADIYGEGAKDGILEAWGLIDAMRIHFEDTNIEGLVTCTVNQRWLNRPFVLFPGELTEEERSYYRPFQFQANDEAQADDLLNLQCTSFIRGPYAVSLASRALERAAACLRQAIALVEPEPGKAGAKKALLADRLRLLSCVLCNAVHAMRFQDIVDGADYGRKPEISPKWPLDAEPALLAYEAVSRAEIDNTLQIIGLIGGREREMLVTAADPALEDVFLLGPDLVKQLRLKTEIMQRRFLDGKRLFVTHNH